MCGGTGDLGGRIADRLRGAVDLRVLARPGADTSRLERLGIPIVPGDVRWRSLLPAALDGVETVVTTVSSVARTLGGERGLTVREVDERGSLTLADAAERAGVARFVFVSCAGIDRPAARSPLARAKLATEERLRDSGMREVVVRPDMFQEVWLSPRVQFDWPRRQLLILGRGDALARYVAIDDVAEAVARLALADDPPRLVEFGGPEALTRNQAADLFERATGWPMRRRHVPRLALRAGARSLARVRPVLASLFALSLAADLADASWTDEPLRRLGIDPRPASRYLAETVASSR
jgi:uncharacterized protein YbjT (DUF2867 family)